MVKMDKLIANNSFPVFFGLLGVAQIIKLRKAQCIDNLLKHNKFGNMMITSCRSQIYNINNQILLSNCNEKITRKTSYIGNLPFVAEQVKISGSKVYDYLGKEYVCYEDDLGIKPLQYYNIHRTDPRIFNIFHIHGNALAVHEEREPLIKLMTGRYYDPAITGLNIITYGFGSFCCMLQMYRYIKRGKKQKSIPAWEFSD